MNVPFTPSFKEVCGLFQVVGSVLVSKTFQDILIKFGGMFESNTF